ncbi:peptidylprolyl isomerase [Sphingomonas sp. G-3-2-10]|uniref:peptidylprolyl isomerase n=1 Tax=Sphingomonas sp. G-3-2-10 TaxID=2728838 RepID=UPI00146E3DD1|nr:peptidylprolyl isomerase [Sphingomonas sp. G-3-2-10]NML06522.1 peptidylprolyl isomerase [Sphingomonas sp. G-3-2-10]
MRFAAALVALTALFAITPAAAQKAPKPTAEPLRGVAATEVQPQAVLTAQDPENTWVLDLSSGGRVTIRLRPDVAPKMVERIKLLTRRGFYNNVIFHRVIDAPESMAQSGDPKGNGTGGSDLPDLPAEFNNLPHVRGAVSAARTKEPDTANSQFFIMFGPRLAFDHNYTVFGRVSSGMEWVDKIERGEPPVNPTRIVHAYIAADNPPPYANAPAPARTALPAGETEVTLPTSTPRN